MLDLKNCPFCGGSTFTRYTVDTRHLNSVVTWHHIRCDAPACAAEMRYPSEEGVIAAWNRRALQAVGPEPAVDYHGLLDDAAFWIEGALKCKEWNWSPDQFDAASDCLSSIRSALVATPPAEPVVEAPQPANSVRGAAERVVSFDWSSNDPDAVAAVDALRAALATKPAVKDDETVVALPPTREYVDRIVRIFRDRPADDTSAVVLQDYARAALSGSGSGWPVPDGWKLVPVEPDDAMIEAGQDTCEEKNSWGGRVYASDIWESMLAASPAAPQQGGV